MAQTTTEKLTIAGVMAALICVATMLVQIPLPAAGGYVNLGDGLVLLAAFLLSPLYGACAAGLGAGLADLISGYVVYVPGTVVIKAAMVLIAGLICRRGMKGKVTLARLLSCLAGECVMVLGYFVYESLVLGLGAGAAANILANMGQGAVGIAVAMAVSALIIKKK